MSLDATDLRAIRQIVREELEPLEGEVTALGNDVKEIYRILADNNLQVV